MATDIDEAVQAAVLVTRDHDRHAAHHADHHVAGPDGDAAAGYRLLDINRMMNCLIGPGVHPGGKDNRLCIQRESFSRGFINAESSAAYIVFDEELGYCGLAIDIRALSNEIEIGARCHLAV